MRTITRVQTFDGVEHANEAAANTHLDNLLGKIVDQYAFALAIETKRAKTALLLFDMLKDVAHQVTEIENDRFLFDNQ